LLSDLHPVAIRPTDNKTIEIVLIVLIFKLN
jgi:hypothetical protein